MAERGDKPPPTKVGAAPKLAALPTKGVFLKWTRDLFRFAAGHHPCYPEAFLADLTPGVEIGTNPARSFTHQWGALQLLMEATQKCDQACRIVSEALNGDSSTKHLE